MIINNVNKEAAAEEKTTVATEAAEETEATTETAEVAAEKAEAAAKRAEEAAERAEEAAKVAGAEEETTTGSVEFEYTGWGGFTRNIDKMGLGMLGIFVVIGIIVIVTSLLNKIKNKD